MDTYLKLFSHLLDNDGKMALGIIYDKTLTEFHENAYAVLRYKLTNISIKIICLCGVHINEEKDYELLLKMLESWKNQYLPIELYLSLSVNDNLKLNYEELKHDNLNLFINDGSLSQFEHYKFIVSNMEKKNGCWVIFTNYNDVWEMNRSCAFNCLINLYNTLKFKDNKKPLYLKYDGEKSYDINHNSFCCSLENFENFIFNIDDELLKNKMCGLYFIKYLNLNEDTHLVLPNKDIFGNIIKTVYVNYVSDDLYDMMILYFSKKKDFNINDFKKFWCFYIKDVEFDVVKKKCLEFYNIDNLFFKFEKSIIII